jgi:hypothetical protein
VRTFDRVKYVANLPGVSDITRQRVSRPARRDDQVDGGGRRGAVEIQGHHVGPLSAEHGSDGPAYSRSGAGNCGDFPRELKQMRRREVLYFNGKVNVFWRSGEPDGRGQGRRIMTGAPASKTGLLQ